VILVLDCETTGLPKKELPKTHPDQPHIVSASWRVFDRDRVQRAAVDTLVNPGRQALDHRAEAVHHLSEEDISLYGVPVIAMLHLLKMHVDLCRYVVAYNVKFDVGMLERDCLAIGQDVRWLRRPRLVHLDLMQCASDLGVAGDGRWVKLTDAYAEAFGAENVPADTHRAAVDCQMAVSLLWSYLDRKVIPLW
jgi:DNA polymerase III epsilon subunit-like protein